MSGQIGRQFEREIAQSARLLGDGVYLQRISVASSRSLRFVGGGGVDFVGVIHGLPVALELKAISEGDRFRLNRVTEAQVSTLVHFARAGGLGLILIRVREGRTPTVHVLSIHQYLDVLQRCKSLAGQQWGEFEQLPRLDYPGQVLWDLSRLADLAYLRGGGLK